MIFRNTWKPKPKLPSQQDCDHDWQTFKETVRSDNIKYTGPQVYLKVRACVKCKIKHYIDYIKGV